MIHFPRKWRFFCQDFCVVCSVPFIFKRRRHLLSFPRRIILGRSISHPISLCETLCWRKNVTLSFFFLVISFVRRKRWTQEAFYSMCQLIEKQLEPTPVTRLNCQCPPATEKRRWTISNQTTEGSENELSFFSPSCQSNLLTLIPS